MLLMHYAVKLKNNFSIWSFDNRTFPTVIRVDIPFSSDGREMFSDKIPTATETVLNNSLRSMVNDCREKFTF